jgi:hypothetical protein
MPFSVSHRERDRYHYTRTSLRLTSAWQTGSFLGRERVEDRCLFPRVAAPGHTASGQLIARKMRFGIVSSPLRLLLSGGPAYLQTTRAEMMEVKAKRARRASWFVGPLTDHAGKLELDYTCPGVDLGRAPASNGSLHDSNIVCKARLSSLGCKIDHPGVGCSSRRVIFTSERDSLRQVRERVRCNTS